MFVANVCGPRAYRGCARSLAAGLPVAVAASYEPASDGVKAALLGWARGVGAAYGSTGYWEAVRFAQRLAGMPEGRHASGPGGLRAWVGSLAEGGSERLQWAWVRHGGADGGLGEGCDEDEREVCRVHAPW